MDPPPHVAFPMGSRCQPQYRAARLRGGAHVAAGIGHSETTPATTYSGGRTWKIYSGAITLTCSRPMSARPGSPPTGWCSEACSPICSPTHAECCLSCGRISVQGDGRPLPNLHRLWGRGRVLPAFADGIFIVCDPEGVADMIMASLHRLTRTSWMRSTLPTGPTKIRQSTL